MNQAGEEVEISPPGTGDAEAQGSGGDLGWADLRPVVGWVRAHKVMLGAIFLIAAQLAWMGRRSSSLTKI